MKTTKPIKILAMGTYFPERISSLEIENRNGIPSGWSQKYSGVSTRHQVTHESNGYMGARAAEIALEKAGLTIENIDLLISASGTYDYPIPNQSSVIKNELIGTAETDFPAMDIDTTCLSFVTAFHVASRMLDGENIKTVLIVSSELASKGLNNDNWETTTLFGDGAAAAILTYDKNSSSLFIKGMQKTYTEGTYHTLMKGGGMKFFYKDHPFDKEMHSFKMNGMELLRLAKNKIPMFMADFFNNLPIKLENVNVIIPHQASKVGIQLFEKMYSFKEGQVKSSLEKYGNCIAASIPITLSDCIDSGEIKRGDSCFLCGTSAGFSIGGVLIVF